MDERSNFFWKVWLSLAIQVLHPNVERNPQRKAAE